MGIDTERASRGNPESTARVRRSLPPTVRHELWNTTDYALTQ
jgi:hypothetical protein